MTLDEHIKFFEDTAKDCLNIDEEKIGLLYADDTECIEEYKASCIQCSKDNQQLADWLKDYKRLKEKESKIVNWQYCLSPNDINDAIKNNDDNWEGFTSAEQIINITYDSRHSCYVVFWKMESEE